MTVEINGIAYVNLTASDFARSREFYAKLLPYLGLKPVFDSDSFYYCVGGRTGVQFRQQRLPMRMSSSSRHG